MINKKLYVIYTGGTIGMVNTSEGYQPKAGYLAERLTQMQLMYDAHMPDYDLQEYVPLIDSANAQPSDWVTIANDIWRNQAKYDGFVVLHGTDTLAYTASALSFMLMGLNKPVICTGAQIPISEPRSDAFDNILHSLIFAMDARIHEVCIYFSKLLLRGNRSVKVDASGLGAFDSPNYPILGRVGVEIELYPERLLKSLPKANLLNQTATYDDDLSKIAMLTVFPGMDASVLSHVLQTPLQGLVLKSYGAGNMPQTAAMMQTLQEATRRGVVIVNCTQCIKGHVNMAAYQTAQGLRQAGVISGADMTDEAALTKLFCLLRFSGQSTIEIKKMLGQNITGELSSTI